LVKNIPVKPIQFIIPKGENIMKLNTPKMITFWVALILGVLGLLGKVIPFLSPYGFWLLAVGFILLVLGLLVKGL
jgi:hypothetical protein